MDRCNKPIEDYDWIASPEPLTCDKLLGHDDRCYPGSGQVCNAIYEHGLLEPTKLDIKPLVRTKQVTLSRGGTQERSVPVGGICVPDLWHIAKALRQSGNDRAAEAVLETWHLANDLLRHAAEN